MISVACMGFALCVLGEGRGSDLLSMVWEENGFGKSAGLVLLRFSNSPVCQKS